jgi:L-aminopeptidase/D-esterase-like protein
VSERRDALRATGTQQLDFKCGIGTASRVQELKGEPFTVVVLDALFTATTTRGRNGHLLHALPIGRTLDLLTSWRAM